MLILITKQSFNNKIMKKSLLILFSLILSAGVAFAQNKVTGIIKSASGTPVPNATVLIRGTKITTFANDKGEFSITTEQEPPFYIQVSSVGYKAQDFQVLKFQDTPLELTLVENAQLDEIVVT